MSRVTVWIYPPKGGQGQAERREHDCPPAQVWLSMAPDGEPRLILGEEDGGAGEDPETTEIHGRRAGPGPEGEEDPHGDER